MSESLVDRARSQALADLVRRSAARYPDKIALVDGATTLRYRELDDLVSSVAGALLDRGLMPGDRVALLARNSWQFAVLSFATARAGVLLVPINFMLRAPDVAFVLQHADASAVVTEPGELLETMTAALELAELRPRTSGLLGPPDTSAPDGWETFGAWLTEPGRPVDVVVGDDDPIRIMYTSGTESRPKGALLSSKALIAQYVSAIVDGGMASDDVDLHTLPMYHCAQLDCFLGPDVYLGATSIVLPAPDPAAVLAAIEHHRVTKFFAPPTVWISLLRHTDFDQRDLSSLRKGYYGASPMPVEVLREIQTRLPDLRLWNFYGHTELAPVATILPPEDQTEHAGSAGRPVLNVETRIVDDDNQPVPAGVVGEVVHRSPQVTLGYYRDPERTAAAFDGGWFHSGDLGVMSDEGRLTIVDRKKDMIKSGGENVASREVEEALYLHPAVAEAAVFGLPDPTWVEAVAAVVVLKSGAAATPAELVEHARLHLAKFKVPKRLFLTDALPKNPSGKILKRDLRQTYEAEPQG